MGSQKKVTVVEANEEQAEQEEEPVLEPIEAQEPKEVAKPKKASRKPKKTSRKAKATAKAAPEGIGPKEAAQAAGVEPTILRRFLRAHPELVGGHEARGRYSWTSLKDPAVQAILKALKRAAPSNGKASGKEAK